MRIVINSGGLGGISIPSMTQHIDELINQASSMTSGLNILKQGIYNMNGGVGNLQNALDNIGSRITQAETHNSNLSQVKQRTEAFISFTRKVDKAVSGIVSKNNEEFYKVNQWARPTIDNWANDFIGHFPHNISSWLDNWTWISDVDGGGMIPFGIGGLALLGLLSHYSGKQNSDIISLNPYASGSGPSGKADKNSVSGSLLSGKAGIDAKIAGVDVNVKTEGELIGGSAKYEMGGKWDVEKGEIGVGITGKAEGHLAKGSVSGGIGLLNEKIEGSVGNVSAKGEAGLTLMKDGKIAPAAKVEASAGANVAQGSVKQSFGTDELDIHSKAEGEFLTAKAKAGASVGVITYTDENTGAVKTKVGAEASAGAEAYIAQGTAKGGVNLFGLKIDLGVSGKAGGAGVKVGGGISTAGASGEIGAGLGLGVGLKVDVDWTEFKPEKILPWNWF